MRVYHKSWQDKRPGFTRRVRWYQGLPGEKVRLNMEEYGEVWNEWFETPEAAQVAYDAFVKVG